MKMLILGRQLITKTIQYTVQCKMELRHHRFQRAKTFTDINYRPRNDSTQCCSDIEKKLPRCYYEHYKKFWRVKLDVMRLSFL